MITFCSVKSHLRQPREENTDTVISIHTEILNHIFLKNQSYASDFE